MKRLAAWISGIFRKEIELLETLISREFARRDQQIATDFKALEANLAAKINELGRFVNDAHSDITADASISTQEALLKHTSALTDLNKDAHTAVLDVKHFIADEMSKAYKDLVKDAAGAARLLEISKIAMAICDDCHLPSRRFAASRIDGRIVCATCAAKGNK
jgi:N-acetylglutamate synthase/N-acetylornithine aminotransferase